MRLAGKIAIVTGAAGGMGAASAQLFAAEGAKVVAVDRNEAGCADVARAIDAAGGAAIGVAADVTKTADILRLVERTVSHFGLPTVLFNNAGVDLENKQSILQIDEAAFDRTIEVNLKGPFLMIKHVAPRMIEAGGGSIVNTASIAAFFMASSAGYSASKAGLLGLTRVAAVELGRYGIRVNALCPGATLTPMADEQRASLKARGLPTIDDLAGRMSVLGRLGRAEDMARMALFLASDESAFATGGSFVNDGGWTVTSGLNFQP
ncbi:MAG: glucose 1-dehydrogenase [Parvularculaceae bacterium]|nr:glucose 1-dehydrogenase [Parvularculaceae bacterium]